MTVPASAPPLPIDAALPELTAALRDGNAAVLVAPPGAGKTTRVPLRLKDEGWVAGRKIIVLEPRRLAARAAADRMARTLGESTGQTVGVRARLASRIGPATRIEVVTEGVFTRMILDDPALEGVAAVLFDEFHERSLDADLGLALVLDCQQALRPDLRILVMSATLDGARVVELLGPGTPLVASEGRLHPVETRYLGRDPHRRLEEEVARAASRALAADAGSILVFLPGQAEIRRVEERLRASVLDTSVEIAPLYGALPPQAQDAAIAPVPAGMRKIVLATSIAETSLTIEGVRIVIDSGLQRVPRYEPDIGITRLKTVRVSRASADQRRGRAGRTEPGICYRLWDEPQTLSLLAFNEPEIRSSSLAGLILDCAEWGVIDPARLSWLDPPSPAGVEAARAELQVIGALDSHGHITAEGRRLRALPLPPRLAHMVMTAAAQGDADLAADVAALVVERGLGGTDVDLGQKLAAFRRDRSRRATDMRRLAETWARKATEGGDRRIEPSGTATPGSLLALAWPERIAKARGARGQFLLANGRAARLDPSEPLAGAPFLAVAEMSGAAASTRILLAAALDESEVIAIAGSRIVVQDELLFDGEARALRARRIRRLGAITLSAETRTVVAGADAAGVLADGIAAIGIDRLPWSRHQQQLRDRVAFLRKAGDTDWPDLSDAALGATARDWLAPVLHGCTKMADIDAGMLGNALDALLPWNLRRRLDSEAPTHFEAPTGNVFPVDYEGPGAPALSIRVQELFGLKTHPAIANGRLPLTLNLLSPAQRPIQVTRDLPGFWAGSWADVRTEMRGRYPKHVWPDDPANTPPTARAKPRPR